MRIEVKCNKCEKTLYTSLYQTGDKHKDCGGEFIPTGRSKQSLIFK